jgi:ATPases with chaperone activity, ATP-binding subunit
MVFDNCDPNTMTVVNTALEQAGSFGHNYLGTEHLLIAFVRHRDLLPEPVGALLPEADVLTSQLSALLGERPRPRDADLLKVVGIDLDEVRASVRQTFGSDALNRLGRRRVHQPWQPWRRPRGGARPCSPEP